MGILYFNQDANTPEKNEDTNFISQFNPFGNKKTTTSPPATSSVDVSGDELGSGEEMPKIKLTKVSSMPIAGFGIFIKERFKEISNPSPILLEGEGISEPAPLEEAGGDPILPPTEFAPAVRYVEKATGNIYQTFADKIIERKFSGTIIPKVYEAYFGNQGKSVIMRYLQADERTIETFIGALPKEYLGEDTALNNEIKGSFLPNNVKDISVSSDSLKIFYLFNSGDGIIGTTLNLLDNKKIQVFDSPFTEWLSLWPNSNLVTLSTKPSANVPGYMYTINLTSKNLTKILGGINGLTTLASPDGKLILYGNNNLSLYLHHPDSKNSDILGVKTLPEKCVWGGGSDVVYCAVPKSISGGEYPDIWYQGEVSFSDQLWKIDAENGNAALILDLVAVMEGEEIDAIKLALDAGENYLFFVNKKDSFLWRLELK